MGAHLLRLPFILLLGGIGALAMFVPAIHGWQVRDLAVARAFLYSGLLFCIIFAMLALAVGARPSRHPIRAQLLSLAGALSLLPALLAVPLYEGAGNVRFVAAWFEMISCLTTTGASVFDGPRVLPETLHLWRGLVGWLGGLLMWVSAAAILAPLNLGGFEVVSTGQIGVGDSLSRGSRPVDTSDRLTRQAARLIPIYGGLTLVLWIALVIAGLRPFDGAMIALSTMSTSGIVAANGPGAAGLLPEAIVLIFLVFAVSRLTFTDDGGGRGAVGRLLRDPEIRLAAAIVLAVPVVLFLRHWWGALDGRAAGDPVAALRALWGALFTTLSFLTTTGFTSAAFDASRAWSGLQTPGLALMGLALVGGGVGTTAGGVKLLRIYALARHGQRELEKLVSPSSVGSSGTGGARQLRRLGAYLAWIFFMLFALSITLVMAALTLAGIDFEGAVVLTIAALSTTGPLAAAAPDTPILYSAMGDPARLILAVAMVLGRLETLALIALFNREFWRG
ncbi:potassium uptake transporter, transmembrane subunit, TrkH [Oceaniovalibus guishaninsula JLT2003]|uniref:Potassium uptake transporter, transmembrane subunit, TrkH n=1 Tax=Oceaniovalibus guishaninsula JLT2003 TaxID=1231392 RepID=K2GLG5_9RHOB|nr:potassium transporter TrkG [Oceaniovalibus guishaninsula]EKE43576.1 potassium uptake transporter, transmembrane subunit, TrkH [Oceaniovalibus guishaninsula JLT2003]